MFYIYIIKEPLSNDIISPKINKYLTQIDRLNIPQYIQYDEELQQQNNLNHNNDINNINNNISLTPIVPQLPQIVPQMYLPPQIIPFAQQMAPYNSYPQSNNDINRKHRRSKHEQLGRDYPCSCGKSFLSQAALNSHIRNKHPELLLGQEKRGRGRPRKYPKNENFFETAKYESFFHLPKRMCENGVEINIKNVVENVFESIYKGKYKDKLFSKPEKYEDNFILDNLVKNEKLPLKSKSEKTCDEVFYEYLSTFESKTNDKYFTLLLKFILLFRECYDVNKNKDQKEENKKQYTNKITPEELPDLCNEFYGDFLDQNDFFGIEEQDDRNEIIDMIQHFCLWLYKNDYTKSKLSLAG